MLKVASVDGVSSYQALNLVMCKILTSRLKMPE